MPQAGIVTGLQVCTMSQAGIVTGLQVCTICLCEEPSPPPLQENGVALRDEVVMGKVLVAISA